MKCLLIGYGSIGRRHYKLLKKLNLIKSIHIITKQDVKNTITFKNLDDVDFLDTYNYFVIANETVKHFKTLKLLVAKVNNKIILVEKPLFHEFSSLEVRENLIFVGYNLRFHPLLLRVKEYINNQEILNVNVICGQYLPEWRPLIDYRTCYSAYKEKGGGVLLDLSHELDYIQWLFGRLTHIFSLNKKISDLEINSDDILLFIGKTINNAFVNITLNYLNKIPIRKLIINTNESTIVCNLLENVLLLKKRQSNIKSTKKTISRDYTYMKMHKSILRSGENVCTYLEGLSVMNIIKKIKENCYDK